MLRNGGLILGQSVLLNVHLHVLKVIDNKKVTYLEISQEQITERIKEEKQKSSVPDLYNEKQNGAPKL